MSRRCMNTAYGPPSTSQISELRGVRIASLAKLARRGSRWEAAVFLHSLADEKRVGSLSCVQDSGARSEPIRAVCERGNAI